ATEDDSTKPKRTALGDITNLSSRASNKPEKSRTKSGKNKVDPVNSAIDENLEAAAISSGSEEQRERSDYDALIFQYLHSLELDPKRRPLSDYMEKIQKDLNPSMRTVLIDWLVEVAEEYKLVSDTLYLAVSYIDRFLSTRSLIRKDLQLLGVTCMLIAAKYEESNPPKVEEFCYITDNTYTKEEVVNMERNVLKLLDFQVGNPTVETFMRFVSASDDLFFFFSQASKLKHECLCRYIAELSLLDYGCVAYIPSLIAASAIFLARSTLRPDIHPWTLSLQKKTGYEAREMGECIKRLHDLQRGNGRNERAIEQKYMDHKVR
ncbi:hypothetical protein M569_01737, partial [Genlisea aurea]